MSVESARGAGTKFTVTLPRKRRPAGAGGADPASRQSSATERRRRRSSGRASAAGEVPKRPSSTGGGPGSPGPGDRRRSTSTPNSASTDAAAPGGALARKASVALFSACLSPGPLSWCLMLRLLWPCLCPLSGRGFPRMSATRRTRVNSWTSTRLWRAP